MVTYQSSYIHLNIVISPYAQENRGERFSFLDAACNDPFCLRRDKILIRHCSLSQILHADAKYILSFFILVGSMMKTIRG